MNFTTTVTKPFIDTASLTPLEINSLYRVTFNGKDFSYNGSSVFYPRAMDYFTALAAGPIGQSIYSTVNAENGYTTVWLSILRNAQTELFFEVFKKAGVYMSKLTCGYEEGSNTLFISGKLVRELSRAADGVRTNIVAYIMTLLHITEWLTEYNLNVEAGEGSSILNYRVDSGVVPTALMKLYDGQTWNVSNEIPDVFASITYHNGLLASTCNAHATYSDTVRFAIPATKDCIVAFWEVATCPYYAVIQEHSIVTSHPLYASDMATDSMLSYLAACLDDTVTATQSNLDGVFKHVEVLDYDASIMPELPMWMSIWIARAVAEKSIPADIGDYPKLKPLGFVTDAALTVVPKEDIVKEYENDEYAQELYKQHKVHYDDFQLGVLEPNLIGFANGDIYSMVFVGESGTGKSTAARVIPDRCGIPYISINFSVNIEEADLFGSMVPNPYKKTADDPEFVWQDGIITKAVRNGYCVILEELNFARPGVLGKLNSLLDENRQVDLSNGELVRAHRNFRMIATCNIAYEGTNRFNKALINRFDDVTEFVDLERTQAIETISKRTGYKNRSKINRVYEVYESVKKFAKEQCISCVVSMRQLLNIFTKGKYYENALDAVTRIMLNGAFLEDAEYLSVYKETILPAFDLAFKI